MEATSNRTFRILDLFSGAGGMALGFEAEGGRTIGAVDVDSASSGTFRRMFREQDPVVFGGPENGDVNQLEVPRLLDALREPPDLIIGGPPCQGFSRIGRAKQASLLDGATRSRHGVRQPERNELYRYFLGVVAESRPLAFVMENVPGMRGALGVDVAGRMAREASHLGYNVRYFLLNAAWYGVPQNRWRIFFVGIRNNLDVGAIPQPPIRQYTSQPLPLEGLAIPEDPWMVWAGGIPSVDRPLPAVTVREALGDLPRLVGHLKGEKPQEARLPLRREPSAWAKALRSWPGRVASETVSNNWYRFNPRDFPIFREMAHGDRYPQALVIANQLLRDELEKLKQSGTAPVPGSRDYDTLKQRFVPPYRNDAFDEKWRKLIPGEPSWTLTAHLSKDTYSHIHYQSSQARTITAREAARLQSFPDAFEFSGNFGDWFRQIGNAVPPLMARALARQLFDQLDELVQRRPALAEAV